MIKFLDLQKVNAQYSAEQHEAAQRVIDSGWYLQGREVESFKKEYASFIGTQYCVTCGNGLDALTLMLRAYIEMGVIRVGDEVLVPANTFIATVNAITENRLNPVFVDVNPDTLQIDESLLRASLTPKTKALLLVHLYGICAYTESIGSFCKSNNLLLLEDNAQAHGCFYGKKRTGNLGSAAAHSFYPGKNLGALGDAGAITTNDETLAKTIRMIANYGFSRKYYADVTGRNSRMDEMQAAFLRVKLQHLEEDNARRQEIAQYYLANISNPLIRVPKVKSVFHIFTIFCEYRNQLQEYLHAQGIETLIHYPVPPHRQKCYGEYNRLSIPVTERLAEEELSLPISPVLTIAEAEQVVKAVNSFQPK